MKNCVAMVILGFTFFACGSKADEVKSFIPGTYARFSDHQFRKEYDTLKIEVASEKGNNYRLVKSSSFQKKLDGQVLPWEYKNEEWIAIYDEEKRILNEVTRGKVISFFPERNLLFVGKTEYKKIN